jgi:heterodisulfide reductase subunit C
VVEGTAYRSFLAEVADMPGGESIRLCMQCGTCSGSCPTADRMDHTPAELISMIRAGLRNEVLSSNAQWRCIACYTCTTRCPRGVKVTDLMHALERLAANSGKANQGTMTPALYRSFNESIYRRGRISEVSLMVQFYLRTNPLHALAALPIAWKMLSHGRLSLGRSKFSPTARKQLQVILDKARSLGGDR